MTPLSVWDGVPQSFDDLNRKFGRTWVRASVVDTTGRNVDSVYFIDGITSAEGVMFQELNFTKGKSGYSPLGNFSIIKAIPDPGLYALEGGGVALVRKLPARQWHEGLNQGNTLVNINGERSSRWGNDVARQLFAPQTDIPLTDGLKLVEETGKCVRLTKSYWLQHRKAENIVNLMRENTRCGSWCQDDFYFAPAGKILREELKDELKFHV